ncbi:MutS-like protein [Chitinophaga dinghuensis]|uniref:MutS-like protein n=1 Tax=Chitinophaga dinghuensis TaxID=1539050 RepID=A0A327W8J0_9BACT|nr:hypothetical protein [Chitinophaga dinghuensis]RAJ85788.1 MutS-like protein [Chitinophaga dinghuensis]
MTPEEIYQQRITTLKADRDREQSRTSLYAWLRLLTFIVTVWGILQFLRLHYDLLWLAVAAVGLVGFLALLKRHIKSQDRLELLKALLDLNEKEYTLITTNKALFEDGNRYVDERHDFTSDLDVFGASSIYQHINRTGTISGSNLLADRLKSPHQDIALIKDTQEALKVLSPELEFRQMLTATATLAKEEGQDKKELNLWLQMPLEFLGNKFYEVARWVLPVLIIAAIFVYAFTGSYVWALIVLTINWLVLMSAQKKVLAQHGLMAHKSLILGKFDTILQVVRDAKFGHARLLQEQQQTALSAGTALHKLARISGALDQRLNLIVAVVLNSLLMYDLHCMVKLEKWKVSHRDDLPKWLDVVAQMEVWNSLATFAYNHSSYSYPVPQEGRLILEATALGHPLIPESECVKNDGSIGRKGDFLIITGSNMSGKSTFLRSVGSNLLLAMCGAPVCADAFVFTPMYIMTSMRIKDSIASHTSYFQAELLRLQHIIQGLKKGKKVFVLLDEILKGTNSEDKLSGSRSLIEHFTQYTCLGMVATHDLELGHLEDTYPERIRNYCFESTIQDDHLYFDYRIREGVARNKNATFLMKQMQII